MTRTWYWLPLLLLCLVAEAVKGQSTFNSTTIYSGGDITLMMPIEETTVTLVVFLVAAIVEFTVDTVSGVENKYLRVMFNAVIQQVMIVGVLILALLFTQTVYNWPEMWVFMFKWSMMCLFVMITLFVLEIFLLLWIARRSTASWEVFETTQMDAQGASLSGWERQYKFSSYKFLDALKAYGYDSTNGVRFSQYLSKMIRRNIFAMTNIKWVSWVVLATVAVLNGLRAEGFMKLSLIGDENVSDALSDWQRLINYASFVLLVGFVAMGINIALVVVLIRRLDDFISGGRLATQSTAARAQGGIVAMETTVTLDTLDDPRSYLFRHSLDATLELVQATMLVSQWYAATFILGFGYQCIFLLSLPYGIPILVAAAVPLIVPMVLRPRLLLVITILGSLGMNLDEYAVQYLVKNAKIPQSEWPLKMQRRLLVSKDIVQRKRQRSQLVAQPEPLSPAQAESPTTSP